MIRGISRRTVLLAGAAVGLLVVGGLIGAVIALAADGGRAEVPNARPTASPSPTLAADDPAVPLAESDGASLKARQYADVLGEAAKGCGASPQWTSERVLQVLTVQKATTAWAMLVALRDKTPGVDCSTLTTRWILGYQVPAPAGAPTL